MRYNEDMQRLRSDSRYVAASKVYRSIVELSPPDMELLHFLYTTNANDMREHINSFISSVNFNSKNLRSHNPQAPTILSDMRVLIDNDPDFKALDKYFTPKINCSESIDSLVNDIESNVGVNIRNKFGQYSQYIVKAAALAMHHQLTRKCGISILGHWVGTAGIIYFLQEKGHIPKNHNEFFRVAVAFLHDFKEDLSGIVINSSTGKPYGLYNTEGLGNDFLPQDNTLTKSVNTLTNLYSEIAKYAYTVVDKQGKAFTKSVFNEFLIAYMKEDPNKDSPMYKIHKNLHQLINSKNYGNLTGEKLLNAITWDSYDYYVNSIWRKSIKSKDDTPIIVKFGDQSYNFMGKETLGDKDIEQNLLKLWMWASSVYASAINLPHTNNFVEELLEDALCYTEHYITKDFMKTEASIPFYTAGFMKIKKLAPIIYSDRQIQ
jgi:hypothetical protein